MNRDLEYKHAHVFARYWFRLKVQRNLETIYFESGLVFVSQPVEFVQLNLQESLVQLQAVKETAEILLKSKLYGKLSFLNQLQQPFKLIQFSTQHLIASNHPFFTLSWNKDDTMEPNLSPVPQNPILH